MFSESSDGEFDLNLVIEADGGGVIAGRMASGKALDRSPLPRDHGNTELGEELSFGGFNKTEVSAEVSESCEVGIGDVDGVRL